MFKEKFETLERTIVEDVASNLLTKKLFTLSDHAHEMADSVQLTAAEALQMEGVETLVHGVMRGITDTMLWKVYQITSTYSFGEPDRKALVYELEDDQPAVHMKLMLDWVGAADGIEDAEKTAREVREACDMLMLTYKHHGTDVTDADNLLLLQATSSEFVPMPLLYWAKAASDAAKNRISANVMDNILNILGIKRR